METNARWLMWILLAALALGAAAIALTPAYRRSLAALARGRPAESPIWQTNRDFYPDVRWSARGEARDDAE